MEFRETKRFSEIIDGERVKIVTMSPVLPTNGNNVDKSEPYIRGPIPLWWVKAAASIPGKALFVGLMIWRWYHISGKQPVKCSQEKFSDIGISRSHRKRILSDLRDSGLISFSQESNKAPMVSVVTERHRDDSVRKVVSLVGKRIE
jgi:hypothetical protein